MPPSWSIAPTLARAAGDPGAAPKTSMLPASGAESPSSMEIVVVLPAPLGPSRASVWPGSTVRLRLSTASTGAEAPRDRVDAHRAVGAVIGRHEARDVGAGGGRVICHAPSLRPAAPARQ